MEKTKLFIKYCFFVLIITISNACNNIFVEDDELPLHEEYNLKLRCDKPYCLDEQSTRSNVLHDWENGDKVLIQFIESNNYFPAFATYKDGVWDIELSDEYSFNSKTGKCTIWYLDGQYEYNIHYNNYIMLYPDELCCVYCTETNYLIQDTNLIEIEATLKPTRYRVRFEGEKNQEIIIKGFFPQTVYHTSKINTGFYSDSSFADDYDVPVIITHCDMEINGKYYTPYFYGGFPKYINSSHSFISLKINDNVFARWDIPAMNDFPNPIISNTIICPTESNHINWAMEKYKSETFIIPEKKNYNKDTFTVTPFYSNTGINVNVHIESAAFQDETKSIHSSITASGEEPDEWWEYIDGFSFKKNNNYYFPLNEFYRGIAKTNILGKETKYDMYIIRDGVNTSSITLVLSNF